MILVGLAENRALTKAFIDVSPTNLILVPRTATDDGTGGRQMVVGTPRDPQVVSLLEPSNSGYQEPLTTTDGSQTTIDFMLLAEWDALVEEEDVFILDGHEYRVMTLMPDNGYEKRALVIRHGW